MSTAQQAKKFASEAAFLDALREVLGLAPIIGKPSASTVYHDAWPPPSDGCRRTPRTSTDNPTKRVCRR